MSGAGSNSRKSGGRSIIGVEAEPSRNDDPSQGRSSTAVWVYPPLTSYKMLPGRAGQTGSMILDDTSEAAGAEPSVHSTQSIPGVEAEPSRNDDPSQGQSSTAVRVYPPLTSYKMLPGRAGRTGSMILDGISEAAGAEPLVHGIQSIDNVPGGRLVCAGKLLESLSGGPNIGTPLVPNGLSTAVRPHTGGAASESLTFSNGQTIAGTEPLSGTELPQGLPGTFTTVEPPLISWYLRFAEQVPVQHRAGRDRMGEEVRQTAPSLVCWLKERPQGLPDRVEIGAPPHSAQGDSLGE